VINLKEKILFIKPFEIESSYASFGVIWKNIKKVLSGMKGIYSYSLIRSVDYNAKYGFISFSAWDSKISFSNAVKNNTVLKYHISKNGEGKKSDFLYLYRILKHNEFELEKTGDKFMFINFIKDEKNNDENIIKFWNEINDSLEGKEILCNSYLCKSIYQFSKFRYIILISVKNDELEDLFSEHLIFKTISLKYKIKGYYSSIYDKNLKNRNIQKILT